MSSPYHIIPFFVYVVFLVALAYAFMGMNKITRTNFFERTNAIFSAVDTLPQRRPNYTSYRSAYWYTDSGVFRRSDHWGRGIRTCNWLLREYPGQSFFDIFSDHCGDWPLGERVGFCAWHDFKNPGEGGKLTNRLFNRIGSLRESVTIAIRRGTVPVRDTRQRQRLPKSTHVLVKVHLPNAPEKGQPVARPKLIYLLMSALKNGAASVEEKIAHIAYVGGVAWDNYEIEDVTVFRDA